jgi:flagellin
MAGMVINTNMMSLNAQRNLRKNQGPLAQAMQRLSSGLRVNQAKDDAAGLAIATRMTSQIRGLTVSSRNAADGLSMSQTAEGALDEMTNNLQRIRELAVQAMSGQYSVTDVNFMQQEVDALVEENSRISLQSKFNNKQLFDGTYNVRIAVSYQASDAPIAVNVGDMRVNTVGANIFDGSFGYLSQVHTNDGGTFDGLHALKNYTTGASTASDAMKIIDGVLQTVNYERSKLGAKSNQFEAAIRNIENVIETTSAAKSRIMDADFAEETANMTKQMILQQSGVSVLAQANSIPQNVLKLLG